MTNSIAVNEWVDVIDQEYLSNFVNYGGSSVKITVASENTRTELRGELRSLSRQRNFQFIELEASQCRVYMPQDIFFVLARRMDWRSLARRVILRLLANESYIVDGIDTDQFSVNFIDQLAKANNLGASFMLTELRPILEARVFKNPNMVGAFRIAMTHLCRMETQYSSGASSQDEYRGQPLLDWLTGENLRIGNVRDFQINTIINRSTARYMIESALYWIRLAGYSGTVMFLDNARVTIARNPQDGKKYYTKAMTMDHYELLREFIDDISSLSGLLLVVATDFEFVNDESTRGWGIYSALRTRVMDDVRDRNTVNPVSSLVRIS